MLRDMPQIRRIPPKASQEDGNHTTRPIRLHLLWQEHGEATLGGHLELQRMQKDSSWWRMDSLVSGAGCSLVSGCIANSVRAKTNSYCVQNTSCGSDEVNDSTSERNCGGLEDDMGVEFSHRGFHLTKAGPLLR